MSTNLIALSLLSDLWIVHQPGGGFECRKCRLVAEGTTAVPDATVLLLHLSKHQLAGHRGADLAVERITCCDACRGRKVVSVKDHDGVLRDQKCVTCRGTGRNPLGWMAQE